MRLSAVIAAALASSLSVSAAHADPVPPASATPSASASSPDGVVPTKAAVPPRDARAVQAHVADLVQRAKEGGLSETRVWRRLLHYERRLLGGQKSRADDAGFFVSRNGKYDPEGELTATLQAVFEPGPEGDRHPICRFPARLAWLDRTLRFDRALLPPVSCKAFDTYFQQVGGKSLTLVFSSYFLNNPASAFGHTFLRVNRDKSAGKGKRRELLDYGMGYAAKQITTNAFLYGMFGLLGVAPGEFTKVPYYYKVREYNDYESRDLWEYDLDLSPEVVRLVVAHFWELGGARFDYWYLDENCSFFLLAALDAADPRLDLTSRLKSVVTPADTVKALFEVPGLVSATRYRPSLRTVLARRLERLSAEDVDHVRRLAEDPRHPIPASYDEARKVAILDAAVDLVDVRFVKQLIQEEGKDTPGSRRKQALLALRAEIAVPSAPVDLAPRREDRVELSHGSSRIGASVGATGKGRGFMQLEYRLAVHDYADATTGYPAHAEVEFLPVRFRIDARTARPRLEDAWLFRARSTSPMDSLQQPLSWRIGIGIQTLRERGCESCRVGTFLLGGGGAVGLLDDRILLFGMGEVRSDFGANVAQWGIPARLGAGPSGGSRVRLSRRASWVTTGSLAWFPAQEPAVTWAAESTVRWAYAQDFASGVTGKATPRGREALVTAFMYF